jgi:hypothetical protein
MGDGSEFQVVDIVMSIGYYGRFKIEIAGSQGCCLRNLRNNNRLTLRREYMAKQWVKVDGRDD